MGSGKNRFLPFTKWEVARTGSCHSVSYGKWQELVLATMKVSQDRLNQLVMGSGKNQFLPFSYYGEWQEPVLAT